MRVINVLKTKNIIKAAPEDTLSHGLSHLNSSHDAAFIFDDNEKFIGVVNPYYSIIKSSSPGNAKIEHSLFHPPKIHTNYPLSRVAQLMMESKIHYLPVFDEQDKFSGIVSARNLFGHLRGSHLFDIKISEYLKTRNKPLVTVFEDDLISTAIHLFKTHKISKLVVINKDMKLRGVLTYYDLIQFLMTPREKAHRGDREGNRISFTYHRVKNFSKSMVLTLTARNTLRDALSLILDKGIGSVVIVDQAKHPVGIITTQEFLRLLAQGKSDSKVEVIGRNLSSESRKIVSSFFSQFAIRVKKIPDLARVKLFIKEEKGGGVFKAVLSLIPRRGKPKIVQTQGKNLEKVLNKIRKN